MNLSTLLTTATPTPLDIDSILNKMQEMLAPLDPRTRIEILEALIAFNATSIQDLLQEAEKVVEFLKVAQSHNNTLGTLKAQKL